MKKLVLVLMAAAAMLAVGCSDDDNPTGSGNRTPVGMGVTTYNAAGGYYHTQLDATSYDAFTGYSFETQDVVTSGVPKTLATGWDIAFRRYVVKLNGGASTENGGDVVAANLGAVDFSAVTISDTAGVSWVEDEIGYQIDNWYVYNPTTHQLTANRYVYAMIDAEGDNYLKFQIDSMVGASMPPEMGTVYMTYFYQSTPNSRSLNGSTVQVAIPVGSNKTYFDFSSGSVVTPFNPDNSTGWDLFFYSYDIGQNSGLNGNGLCGAYSVYNDLMGDSLNTDPWDIDAWTQHPYGAQLFRDDAVSGVTDWWWYTGQEPPEGFEPHQVISYENVYLLRTGGKVYKLKINSYYGDATGGPTSGWIDFFWAEL